MRTNLTAMRYGRAKMRAEISRLQLRAAQGGRGSNKIRARLSRLIEEYETAMEPELVVRFHLDGTIAGADSSDHTLKEAIEAVGDTDAPDYVARVLEAAQAMRELL